MTNCGHNSCADEGQATDPSVSEFSAQPVSESVTQGSPASFGTALAGTPVPGIQWRVSTDGGVTWCNVPGATRPTYSFAAALTQNAYKYRAVASDGAGTARTKPAELTVTARSESVSTATRAPRWNMRGPKRTASMAHRRTTRGTRCTGTPT